MEPQHDQHSDVGLPRGVVVNHVETEQRAGQQREQEHRDLSGGHSGTIGDNEPERPHRPQVQRQLHLATLAFKVKIQAFGFRTCNTAL